MTLVSLQPEDFETTLPTPEELKRQFPLTANQTTWIEETRQTTKAIINGVDKRKLLIVGPCSIHDMESTIEYAHEFRKLAKDVSDQFFMIMRAYVEKPRTITGWKGLLYDPELNGSYHVSKGLHLTRDLFFRLTEMGVPIACELLEINTAPYFCDYLTWGCIGARTCSSSPHRQLAAHLAFPVGFKNTVDGCIDNAIHGAICAQKPHVFLGLSPDGKMSRIQSKGNDCCHIVLRGGKQSPNYGPHSIMKAEERCIQSSIPNRFLIDCSHDNCEKRHLKQISVFHDVIQQIVEGNQSVAGLMLESHLYGGTQPISSTLRYGVSITDPCLDWKTTKHTILKAAHALKKGKLCLNSPT